MIRIRIDCNMSWNSANAPEACTINQAFNNLNQKLQAAVPGKHRENRLCNEA